MKKEKFDRFRCIVEKYIDNGVPVATHHYNEKGIPVVRRVDTKDAEGLYRNQFVYRFPKL
jgi:hypothetical protein